MRLPFMAVLASILFSGSVAVAGPVCTLKAWEDKPKSWSGAEISVPVTLVATCRVEVSSDDTPEFREAAGGSNPQILQLHWIMRQSVQPPLAWKRVWFEKQIAPGTYSEVEVRLGEVSWVSGKSNGYPMPFFHHHFRRDDHL